MHLIVGVDPGTTTGLASVDFQGNVVDLFSSKDMGLDRAVEHLVSVGTVSIVATDVSPAPGFILRLAAKVGAVVYTPPESALVLDKIALTRSHTTGDAHQRDALAAALLAYGAYRNKFAKIDSLGLDAEEAEGVKHLVIRGFSVDKAKAAIANKGKKAEEKKEKAVDKPVRPASAPVPESEYSRRMAMLERQNAALREQIASKDAEIMSLKEASLKMRREYTLDIKKSSEIRKKELSIRSLKHILGDLRKRLDATSNFRNLWDKTAGGVIAPVGLFPGQMKGFVLARQKIAREDLDALSGAYVVFTDEKANRDLLKAKGILYADTRLIGELDGCFFVHLADVEAVKQNARVSSVSLEDIVEGYRKKRD